MSSYKKCIYEIAKTHMLYAMDQIRKHDYLGEVPVYAILFNEEKIFVESTNSSKIHAEEVVLNAINNNINAITDNLSILITLEPCPSCAFKILQQSNIKNVFFGGFNYNYGALGGKINLSHIIPNKINIYGGIYRTLNENLIQLFFQNVRNNKVK